MADGADLVACLVKEFCGERTSSDAGAIGFEDTIDLADSAWCQSQTRASAGTDSVAGGDERIGTEVHVQKRTLCALAKDGFALGEAFIDEMLAVDEAEPAQVFDALHPLFLQCLEAIEGDRRAALGHCGCIERVNHIDMAVTCCRILLGEVVEDIAHTQAVPAHFVGIGRTYSFASRAYFGFAFGGFVGLVEQAMRRQNQVRLFGD